MGKALVTKKQNLPVVSEGNISSYLNFVNKIPTLTEEEEKKLALAFKYNKDLDAAQKIILAHLKFVAKMAYKFSGYGLPIADLIQEGNLGLMKAVSKFDPEYGVRFVSFAVHWIKAEMHDYVIKNWKIVKIATTKEQRKLFFNLRSSKKNVFLDSQDVKDIAKELGVKEKTVIEMDKRMTSFDASLDYSKDNSDGSTNNNSNIYLEDHSSNIEDKIAENDFNDKFKLAMMKGMKLLDDRSKDIIASRWLADKKVMLSVLAKKYKVSSERIRQIEEEAIATLKEEVLKEM